MVLIAALLGVFSLYFLQGRLYRKYWAKNLSTTIHFSKSIAVEGDENQLIETVINKKLLPLPLLKVKFMTSKDLEFMDGTNSTVTDNYYRNDLLPIMMYQKLTRTLPFVCSHRGYYNISSIELVCSDIFISFEGVLTKPANTSLYVYPKSVDANKLTPPFQKILGTLLTKRYLYEDPFEFRSIREYQFYDTLKSINWKASAKTGSYMVNVKDYTASQEVKILLNLEQESIWRYEDLEEESIRLTASLASSFMEQGIPISIATNGKDLVTKETVVLPAGSGSSHLNGLYEALSRIDTSLPKGSFVHTVWEDTPVDYLIIISYYQKEDLQELLLSLQRKKIDFTWIIPTNQELKVTARETLQPAIVEWKL
ncbi:hypothetical protein acsn021_10430 [Anaerocolumna cellulosilytica]|uniref:DUF58 domain-containing protein n=1 Tax=Anaerocolumna cellulosilytica TaxID=433286 RepID=A0A6S6QS82_9FIRM|nr:DUF58 domain-containing protein [Anaerocolumna cellulosilytica]MBB5194530.1 uncharacterized protein (DUF58 family) [Anaerocolumna cellulosilytica]BCJ93474.1 hypothetical protein acsn021_10430 [Anaerocolumna cellulosilytica]